MLEEFLITVAMAFKMRYLIGVFLKEKCLRNDKEVLEKCLKKLLITIGEFFRGCVISGFHFSYFSLVFLDLPIKPSPTVDTK
jgi:hypothetical protein